MCFYDITLWCLCVSSPVAEDLETMLFELSFFSNLSVHDIYHVEKGPQGLLGKGRCNVVQLAKRKILNKTILTGDITHATGGFLIVKNGLFSFFPYYYQHCNAFLYLGAQNCMIFTPPLEILSHLFLLWCQRSLSSQLFRLNLFKCREDPLDWCRKKWILLEILLRRPSLFSQPPLEYKRTTEVVFFWFTYVISMF